MENKNNWQQRHEASQREKQNEWHDHTETDKYLNMEQHGVSYTGEDNHTMNSDDMEFDNEQHDKWRMSAQNSRNSDAFSQDDYILRDNINLDEEQNTSLSNDDKQ